MRVTPLAAHSPRAVRETLERHGWDPDRSVLAAAACDPVILHVTGLDAERVEALVRQGASLGIDLVTGEDWVVLAGMRSRFGAFSRPWQLPPELAEVAFAVGAALPGEQPLRWRHAAGELTLDRPRIAGIINATPDSFSDGGLHLDPDRAAAHAERLLAEGATLLDVGGESTRPGATPVSVEEELARVVPVVERLVREHPGVPVAVDTVKAAVAERVLDAGAAIVNDVSGLRLDPAMGKAVARAGAGLVLMHSRGTVDRMAALDDTDYGADAVAGILEECRQMLDRADQAGVEADRVVLDPGLGFAKTAAQSLELLDRLAELQVLGRPLYVGPSRKRFLGAATGRETGARDPVTAVACAMAWERGARLFRVHDAAATRDALTLAAAVRHDAGPLNPSADA